MKSNTICLTGLPQRMNESNVSSGSWHIGRPFSMLARPLVKMIVPACSRKEPRPRGTELLFPVCAGRRWAATASSGGPELSWGSGCLSPGGVPASGQGWGGVEALASLQMPDNCTFHFAFSAFTKNSWDHWLRVSQTDFAFPLSRVLKVIAKYYIPSCSQEGV